MSSDDTKAKFDLTDHSYCTPCEKFDPENDILVDGEDSNVDSEESITPEAEDEAEENSKEKDKNNSKDKESKKELTKEGKKPEMTHEMKLKVIKNTFKDWLEYCDISEDPMDNMSVNISDTL